MIFKNFPVLESGALEFKDFSGILKDCGNPVFKNLIKKTCGLIPGQILLTCVTKTHWGCKENLPLFMSSVTESSETIHPSAPGSIFKPIKTQKVKSLKDICKHF